MKKITVYFIFSLFLSVPLAGHAQTSPEASADVRISPNNDRNVAIGWDFVHSVVAGKLDRVKQLFAPDFVCYGPGGEDVNRTDQYIAIWKERYKEHLDGKTADVAGVSLENRSEEGKWQEWVMLWFDYSAKNKNAGVVIKIPTQLTIKLVNGKIAELHEYFDTGAVIRKSGQGK